MRYFLTIGLLSLASSTIVAQTKAKPATATKKPVTKTTAATGSSTFLKTLADSASYAIGINLAQQMKKDIGDLNSGIVMSAMKNTFDGKAPMISEEKLVDIMQRYSEKAREQESAGTIKEGTDFLAKNKTAPGVKTTASGLQYLVVQEGSGIKPTANDTVICNYRGSLVDGTEFDNSYERGEPLTIPVGAVIKGWTEGLQLMSKGSKYKFFIPQELGYGMRQAGQIPAGSTLIFEVELLDIKK